VYANQGHVGLVSRLARQRALNRSNIWQILAERSRCQQKFADARKKQAALGEREADRGLHNVK
jgi:hypothetical protein